MNEGSGPSLGSSPIIRGIALDETAPVSSPKASGQRRVDVATLERKEFGGLHLAQTRDGAWELVRQRAFGVQVFRLHGR